LLYAEVSVQRRVPDGADYGPVLFVGIMLICLKVAVSFAQSEVYKMHNMGFFFQANQKILGL
jgi:hypothetical protein